MSVTMPENCLASIVACIACVSRCRRSLENPTVSGFTVGSGSTVDAALTPAASIKTQAIRDSANESERFIVITFLCDRRRLPLILRQALVDARPRGRLRCPDRRARPRDLRIIQSSGAHE